MKANMRVSCHQLTIALLLGLFAFVATGSPTSAQIQGRVTEFFSEKPLADATVSIRGFRFEAHTDANGNYSIDYVPGSIELTAQKPGYVLLADRSLNLATVARAPIEDLVMIKALPGPGIFIGQWSRGRENGDYVAVANVSVSRAEERERDGMHVQHSWTISGQPTQIPRDTTRALMFVFSNGTLGEHTFLMRVQPGGVVARASQYLANVEVKADRIGKLYPDRFGTSGIAGVFHADSGGKTVYFSRLTQGLYAICEWRRAGMNVSDLVPGTSCYYLQLGQAVDPAAPSANAASEPHQPAPPTGATSEKWQTFIQEESRTLTDMPRPTTDWRELVVMQAWGKYDTYQELYLLAVNRRNLAADALMSAHQFLATNDLANVEKFALLYSGYYRQSNDLLVAAEQVSSKAVTNTATVLERVYNTTSESAKYGSYLMCGPKCYEVADFVFLGTDFAVDYGIKGEDAATKQLVAHAMSKALLQTSGFSTLMQNRTTHLIGSSGLYSLLNQTVGDPAFQKSVMTILAQSGAYAASRLTGDRMTAATKALGDFVQRSSNFDRSLSTKMSSPPRD